MTPLSIAAIPWIGGVSGMDLLLLLPLVWCAEASIGLDMILHLELHRHAELVGVVVVAMEGVHLFLFGPPGPGDCPGVPRPN